MAESFNAWILGPRHKTIISILEEIRIKVTNRISKSRAFAETWTYDISPMAMMVFNVNVERSMQCNIDWNGDEGFEVLEGSYWHTVNLGQKKCSCRSWELKVPNMKMWPKSTNPIVEPPECAEHSQQSSNGIKRGRGQCERGTPSTRGGGTSTKCRGTSTSSRGVGVRSGYKRPRVVGQGVFVAETGYTAINQGLASSRRVNTGVRSSALVTCDIGYHPTKGLKWKGKQVVTQRELQVQSAMHRIKTRSKAVGIQTRAQAKAKSTSKAAKGKTPSKTAKTKAAKGKSLSKKT
ncbi:uncharacterized protein LOC132038562 [Lycium ferocissimum]|uniref:uncharacterized protein LOC132038562 n=1 Tax=Lycium ferocissimum TaxID=112874 RepID=UPI002816166E|nr:uncharacterized protein LOC132038562 [Lycium ferocissimum]